MAERIKQFMKETEKRFGQLYCGIKTCKVEIGFTRQSPAYASKHGDFWVCERHRD